ncbi:hypothetical protein H6503_04765 [Candidatus Woesearchaeota archaeon]|nr:hypothetical protein [Candidatus Woesearchaeota archaeon]
MTKGASGLLGFHSKELQKLPLEEQVKLYVKLQLSSIPAFLIDMHPKFLPDVDYLCGLQKVGNAVGASLFTRGMFDEYSTSDMVDMIKYVDSSEQFRLLAKKMLNYNIRASERAVSQTSRFKVSDHFKDFDDMIGYIDATTSWMIEESPAEFSKFHDFLNHYKHLAKDGMAAYAGSVIEAARLIKHAGESREMILHDFLGKVSEAIRSPEELIEAATKLPILLYQYDMMDIAMKRPSFRSDKRRHPDAFRHAFNYYTIFDTLKNLTGLHKTFDDVALSLRIITDFGKKIESRYDQTASYSKHSKAFSEYASIIGKVGHILKRHKQLEELLLELDHMDTIASDEMKEHISHIFSSGNFMNKDHPLRSPTLVIGYTRLIGQCIEHDIYSKAMLEKMVMPLSRLTRGKKQFRELGEMAIAIERSFRTKKPDAEDEYYKTTPEGIDFYGLLKHLAVRFKDFEDVKSNLPRVKALSRYIRRYDWGASKWHGNDSFESRTRTILSVSDDVTSFINNLRKATDLASSLDDMLSRREFISEVIGNASCKYISFEDFYNDMVEFSDHLRRMTAKGIPLKTLLDYGTNVMHHELRLSDRLIAVESVLAEVPLNDSLNVLDFFGSISSGLFGYHNRPSPERFIQLYGEFKKIYLTAQESGFDLGLFKPGEDHSNLHKNKCLDRLDECCAIVRDNLLPCNEVVELYSGMTSSKQKIFAKDVYDTKATILASMEFNPLDFTECYALYMAIILGEAKMKPHTLIHTTFSRFNRLAESYVKGERPDFEREGDEIRILRDYTRIKNPHVEEYYARRD